MKCRSEEPTWPSLVRQRTSTLAGSRSVTGSVSGSSAKGHGFDALSGHILPQEGQLSVTGGSMYTKYWLTA